MQVLVKGFEEYSITNTGDVISYKYGKKKLLKKIDSGRGYYGAELWNGSSSSRKLIHRLVAEAFIPNPENKPQVNHKDGNKLNNNVSNLEWATVKENNQHARATGLCKCFGERHHRAKLSSIMVNEMRLDYSNGKSINMLTERYNVSSATIRRILSGKIWKDLPIQEYTTQTKLTIHVMKEIKKMKMEGLLQKDISIKTGISTAEVSRLVNGKIFVKKYQSIKI